MSAWPFDQPKDCAVFTTTHVMKDGQDIIYVFHDEDDHGWQFHYAGEKNAADAMIVAESRVGPPNAATGQPGLTFPTERERTQAAVTKFKAAADAYPSTDAGLFARYQEAAMWMALGNPAQAAATYQQVIDKAVAYVKRCHHAPSGGFTFSSKRLIDHSAFPRLLCTVALRGLIASARS